MQLTRAWVEWCKGSKTCGLEGSQRERENLKWIRTCKLPWTKLKRMLAYHSCNTEPPLQKEKIWQYRKLAHVAKQSRMVALSILNH
eukprot:1982115-Amphidinium_carterae.2